MSGLLPPPSGAGVGEEDRILGITPERSGAPSKNSYIIDRKPVFGRPTSRLSSSTDLPSQKETVDNKPRVSDVGRSPVRDPFGKLMHLRKDGARYSEDNPNHPPSTAISQPDEQGSSRQREGEKKERRWDSARARLGSVLPTRHNIRDTISRVRRKSVDPSHLMDDLNSRESRSRAGLEPPSACGPCQQSPPPPDVTAATSTTDSTFPGRSAGETLNVPGTPSPSGLSSRFASWRSNLGSSKGRGRGSLQGREGAADSAVTDHLRSSSAPPPQKFKVRVNRFLRSGRRSVSPKTESPNSESTAPEHLQSLGSTPNVHTPPYLSSTESSTVRGTQKSGFGFRHAVRRGVSSARRKMSVPFLSVLPPSSDNAVSDAPAVEPPERPQTTPPERRGEAPGSSGGSQFMLNGRPGHSFLPSEAADVVPLPAPPIITGSPRVGGWIQGDFEHIPMIQSRPPLLPPGTEDPPPLSPWMKAPGEPQPWLELTGTSPRLPEITSVAPFAVDEMTRDFATAKTPSGGQNWSDKYWTVASGSGIDRSEETQARGKGKERAKSTASDHLKPPEGSFFLETSSGKSIEVLDEEKRRKSRDTGIMGLDPEIAPSSEVPMILGPGEKDDDGEFTYAAAVREIAGLGRFPKRPPPDTSTDDVSVPMPECDYDLPLPNFRFSILPEPSSSSNEPDASPCAASSSLTQETSGSAIDFTRLASTNTQISTISTTPTTTTTRTTTATSTNPSTSVASPSDYAPYNYQMLLSSKRPYLFVLQELSSGTYIKITPQKNSSPVSRSLSTLTPSYPETPAPSQMSPSDARSPASVRFINSNGLLAGGAEAHEEMDEGDVDDEEEDEDRKGKGREKKKK